MSDQYANELYSEAVALVKTSGNASVSHLQRKMQLGYNRAASLIERMQAEGIVTAPDMRGARFVARQEALAHPREDKNPQLLLEAEKRLRTIADGTFLGEVYGFGRDEHDFREDLRMILAASPAPQHLSGEREAVARIIDPTAAQLADELKRTAALPERDRPPVQLVADATRDCDKRMEVALAKADTILRLQSPALRGGREQLREVSPSRELSPSDVDHDLLVTVAQAAADQFEFYAREHKAKGTSGGLEKALVNQAWADELRSAAHPADGALQPRRTSPPQLSEPNSLDHSTGGGA